ncbi:MAG: excinuclease ABC subunit UvrC [Sulfuricurvum sp.]|uniref:excinuclease ABC subunit UvrC n=1 Tax=Sulfuricurvum sp. TaxID=2025608 RepID=UPI0026293C92|nr:excinuclease ABC subunit UvrC [Sulfuricurvum sp.]MDD2368143.1 excinuclease ABC subunit UvrC [Sulfuricurvum sp.]MDD5118445.1 excinuclease ABC subunit UvrC [Sulfuricurvum sp.]
MLDQIRSLPHQAGIYQYLDEKGRILYIGKAKNLSKRVKSYFNLTPTLSPKMTLSLRIQKMLSETVGLHYIIVENEHDALILENSLIKQLKPKYNILLRDDKTYPYLYVDMEEKYPRFELTRKIIKGKGVRYFGPFSVGARDILDSLYELLKLVQKKSCLKGKKGCLFYQMEQCLAPCEFPIPRETYLPMVTQGIEWIQNKRRLIKQLETKMEFYSESLRFEEALVLRDRIERISKSELTSQIDMASNENYDVFAIALNETRACILRLFIREGKVASSTHDFLPLSLSFSLDEAYERTLIGFYGNEIPPIIAPILTAHPFESREWVRDHLTTLFGKKASIEIPQRGGKKELIDLALTNAYELLRTQQPSNESLLYTLQELFKLDTLPRRIEIFDNSHFGGTAPVGAMVVYDNGHFDKKGYRTFHLQSHDEYGQMSEMLRRRIEGFADNPPPDLWVLDGGETLRILAVDLLNSHGVHLDVIAISKEKIDAKAHRAKGSARDILHTDDDTLRLEGTDKRLQFVQMLRDEAHRSAITFHKKSKLKLDQHSKLLSTHGISQAKIHKLLEYYGTFEAIAKSDFETLQELIGAKDAKNIQNCYQEEISK